MLRTSPRTQTLLRVYLGLLTVAIVLCSVHIQHHLFGGSAKPEIIADSVLVPHPRERPRNPGPSINWGGQKR